MMLQQEWQEWVATRRTGTFQRVLCCTYRLHSLIQMKPKQWYLSIHSTHKHTEASVLA